MKDLDFDELDRAVNSLVSQAKSGRAAGAAPKEAPTSAPAAAPRREVTVSESQDTVPVKTPAPTPEPEPAQPEASAPAPAVTPAPRARLGAKRPSTGGRGSFIDIMAPKPSTGTPKVSRTGSAIQPMSKIENSKATPTQKETEPQPELAEKPSVKPVETAIEPPAPKAGSAQEGKTASEEKWPDPLDFHDDDTKVVAEAAKHSETQTPPEEEKPVTPKWQQQPESGASPFLPDTKVEKRPLGAFASASQPVESEKPAPEPAATEKAEPTTPEARPTDVPEELKPEMLAVESNQLPEQAFEEPAASEHAQKPVETAPEAEEPETEEEEPREPKAQQQVRDSALQSIPQQYKTPTKHVDDAPRPVFDTKEYHPPLLEATAHAAHRNKSPWGKLFIALLVLAVLAVGGYFAFIYFVQNY